MGYSLTFKVPGSKFIKLKLVSKHLQGGDRHEGQDQGDDPEPDDLIA